jgi:hypothetical protein
MLNERALSGVRSPSVAPDSKDVVYGVDTSEEIKSLKRKFWWFSLVASLNHALNYVVTSYATSLLNHSLAGIILGLSWSLNAVSGLTVATAIVRRFGFKYSMIISLWGYAIQIATLYWAVKTDDDLTSWIVAIAGSTLSGFTSAVWWTSQGVYFEDVCQSIDRLMSRWQSHRVTGIDSIRADLSAHWTVIYQSADIVVFLTLSVFPAAKVLGIDEVLFCLVILGIITSLLGFTFENIGSDSKELPWSEIWEAIIAVPEQYRSDCRVSLLGPFVFGFGITTALFAYYVNSDAISDSSNLGTVSLGFLEAFSYFVAVISAYPYAYVANSFEKGQDWVIQFGSVAFMSCGVLLLVLNNEQLGTWNYILFAKFLYGLGRGVFEGSCRAVYAKMFTGKDLSTAFSGQTLSAGFSGGISFFVFSAISRNAIGLITVSNGILAVGCYFLLMYRIDPLKPTSWSELCGGKYQRLSMSERSPNTNGDQSASISHVRSPLLSSIDEEN